MLPSKRSHHGRSPRPQLERSPRRLQPEKSPCSNEDPAQPKQINKTTFRRIEKTDERSMWGNLKCTVCVKSTRKRAGKGVEKIYKDTMDKHFEI